MYSLSLIFCEPFTDIIMLIMNLYMDLNSMKRIMYAYWETLMQHLVLRDLMKFVTCCMIIM